jgi:hypothetical protein
MRAEVLWNSLWIHFRVSKLSKKTRNDRLLTFLCFLLPKGGAGTAAPAAAGYFTSSDYGFEKLIYA